MIAQTSAVNTDAESGNLMEITVFDGKQNSDTKINKIATRTKTRTKRENILSHCSLRGLHVLLFYFFIIIF